MFFVFLGVSALHLVPLLRPLTLPLVPMTLTLLCLGRLTCPLVCLEVACVLIVMGCVPGWPGPCQRK